MEADTLYQLAVKLYHARDYENAHHTASLLRQLDPLSERSYKILGNINQAWGKYSWAIGAYQRAFMFSPTDESTAYQTAQCYIHLQEWTKAKQWLETAIFLNPDNQKYQQMLQVVQKKFC